ncbi:hypothetical protein KIPB_000363 [Kipferlia bialata]|uniref:Inner membrane component domain-containing protein n=1 Tax=Kipferlia bialata TaxID=797122 RepID=A0A9K3CNF3_9EUKA|nr:hypothetical protein KIPB_000363 [Kipferlia bialata]|eukprot:g363.t1
MDFCDIFGNLLWFIVGGEIVFLFYLLAGAVLCVTIIGIPFGIQLFKIAMYAAFPFGRVVRRRPDATEMGICGNVVWMILAGWFIALVHTLVGCLFAITIIGWPFACGHWRLARLAFMPFNHIVETKYQALAIEQEKRRNYYQPMVVY